jgi:tripartite-type tricarboxylate transporter receptor subunit TctC
MKAWTAATLAAGLVATGSAGVAQAQAYPAKPVRLIAPFAPGGTTDIVARILAQRLTEVMGQTVAVENRAGAGGNIAADHVAKSAPDGYTILQGFPGLVINPSLYKKLTYDAMKDLAPVSLVSAAPLVLVVHPALPVKSAKDLIALAKKRPGELSFPSAGNGTSSHLSAELFKSMAGVDMLHVPYKGSAQGLLDLVSGRMQLMINPYPEMIPFIQAGKMRALGISTRARIAVAPDLPTIAESGVPGYEVTTWNGLVVPAGTPREIIAKLHGDVVKVLANPAAREQLTGLGLELIGSTPAEFTEFMKKESVKWAEVVRKSGARLD